MDQGNEVSFKLVKELYVGKVEENLHSLRLGHWIVNGKQGPMILEKRGFWRDRKGDVKPGKAQGLNASDLYRVQEMMPEISKLMNFPIIKQKEEVGA